MSQDTKRMILAMVVALGLMFAYYQFIHWMWPPQKPVAGTQPAPSTQVAQGTRPSTTATTQAATTQQGPVTTAPAPVLAQWRARSAGDPMKLTLGSPKIDDPDYVMAVELTSKGSSIDAVTLNRFRQSSLDKVTRYTFQKPLEINGVVQEDARSLQTRWITVDGQIIDLANVQWKVESYDRSSATFSVDVLNGDVPTARITKTYTLPKRNDDHKTNMGYEVVISYKYENLVDRPLVIKTQFNGPTAPPKELERQPDQNVVVGFWNDGAVKVISHSIEAEFNEKNRSIDLTKNKDGKGSVWAGEQSAYFNALLRPAPFDAKEPYAGWVSKVSAELLNPSEQDAEKRRVALRFETTDFTIPANQTRSMEMDAYFGPKGRKVLGTAYYEALPRQYSETLVIKHDSGIAWLCSMCTWQWLINVLVWLLTIFHTGTRDWGLAIIVLVVLVRALLHPITKKSQVHMMKMQKMAPELEKLKKKFGDNKEELSKAQMSFYKEQGMTPILGCLPMFLQMPIWIALWNSLQSTFELRHSPFLYGFTWIKDLSKPDYLIRFDQPLHLPFGMQMGGIHILPLLLGVVFYLSSKLQPKPPTMTPEQKSQQKMMEWMSALLFPLMLYNGPSGLNLYILTSTAFGIVESKVIRKHLKEREELEAKMGPTIVDGPTSQKKEPEKKGWLARLAEKAEQIKKEADKRQKGR